MNHKRMLIFLVIGAGVLALLGLAGLPVSRYLVFLALLACPLMMIFMMRGHGHEPHGGGGEARTRRPEPHSHGKGT